MLKRNFHHKKSTDGLLFCPDCPESEILAVGMAPYAHLAVYKVCFGLDWPESDILTGLDAAVADGADVISISIGEENMPFFQDSIAIASFQEKNAFFSQCNVR